jgi:hypothetical protein
LQALTEFFTLFVRTNESKAAAAARIGAGRARRKRAELLDGCGRWYHQRIRLARDTEIALAG